MGNKKHDIGTQGPRNGTDPVASADITATLLHLPGRIILVASIYVPGHEGGALQESIRDTRQLVTQAKAKANCQSDTLLLGDFNHNNQLWGGDDVATVRQGEADPIIDLMKELALQSTLRRGTKKLQRGNQESTIDLVLASEEFAERVIKCKIHDREHGSDHRAIETSLDTESPARQETPRLLFKNALWKTIREKVTATLGQAPWDIGVRQQADQLMTLFEKR